jgi:hypothetical protein
MSQTHFTGKRLAPIGNISLMDGGDQSLYLIFEHVSGVLGKGFSHEYDKFAGVDYCKAIGKGDLCPEIRVIEQRKNLSTFEKQSLQVLDIDIDFIHNILLAGYSGC